MPACSDAPSDPDADGAAAAAGAAAGSAAASRRCAAALLRAARRQGALLALVVSLAAALPYPGPGARLYKKISTGLVVALFFLCGLTIPFHRLRAGALSSLHVHAGIQTYSLLLMPALYYAAAYYPGWATETGLLTDVFAAGTMAAMCMPTTTTTCVLFTQQAGGDDAVAAASATLGNLLGALVAPLTAHLFIGGRAPHQHVGKMLEKMGASILAPMLAGAAAQLLIARHAPGAQHRLMAAAGRVFSAMLLVIFYFIFCSCFDKGSHGVSPGSIALMVAWVTALHLVFLAGAWGLAHALPDARQRVACAMVAPQKTEGMAVAILNVIFSDASDQGLYVLPVAAYHSAQMVIAALLIAPLRRYVDRRCAPPPPPESAAAGGGDGGGAEGVATATLPDPASRSPTASCATAEEAAARCLLDPAA